jgi:hypothetical protein
MGRGDCVKASESEDEKGKKESNPRITTKARRR